MGIIESLEFAINQGEKISKDIKFRKIIDYILENNNTNINRIIEDTKIGFIEVTNVLDILEEYELIRGVRTSAYGKYGYCIRILDKFGLANI